MNVIDAFNRWQQRAAWRIFVGACACYGGVNMLGGNVTQNQTEASPPNHNGSASFPTTRNTYWNGSKSLFIPGCPAHPDWIILSIVHILTYSALPPVDTYRRPKSILGSPALFNATVHSQCPRKPEHDLGHFAASVGDPVKCLRAVGCRGTETYADCPTRGWNSSGKYCTAPGINHLCIGCSQPMFPAVPFNRQINNITFP